ncbi:MAG: hypothetical protein HZY76_14290 [Anaerolineae bacterium]|nr:MAG: hypothetical protein HZY76_14290 [Anaerolineae bacterium]
MACGAEDGQFSEPRGAAIDADGYVYVADTGNRRIVKLDPAGKFVTAWGQPGDSGGEFQEPFDLVAAPDGTLVVLDATQQALQRFTADGEFLDLFGTENSFYRPRSGRGRRWLPVGCRHGRRTPGAARPNRPADHAGRRA